MKKRVAFNAVLEERFRLAFGFSMDDVRCPYTGGFDPLRFSDATQINDKDISPKELITQKAGADVMEYVRGRM